MLMFANDLLLFSHGDPTSVSLLKSCLERFTTMFGLNANSSKSDCFVSCLDDSLREEIFNASGFWKGNLPMRYLGVPLLSSKLSYASCQPIIDKVKNRIYSWRNRLLSFGGRL